MAVENTPFASFGQGTMYVTLQEECERVEWWVAWCVLGLCVMREIHRKSAKNAKTAKKAKKTSRHGSLCVCKSEIPRVVWFLVLCVMREIQRKNAKNAKRAGRYGSLRVCKWNLILA